MARLKWLAACDRPCVGRLQARSRFLTGLSDRFGMTKFWGRLCKKKEPTAFAPWDPPHVRGPLYMGGRGNAKGTMVVGEWHGSVRAGSLWPRRNLDPSSGKRHPSRDDNSRTRARPRARARARARSKAAANREQEQRARAKSEKQVPHRSFRSVRNDKDWMRR